MARFLARLKPGSLWSHRGQWGGELTYLGGTGRKQRSLKFLEERSVAETDIGVTPSLLPWSTEWPPSTDYGRVWNRMHLWLPILVTQCELPPSGTTCAESSCTEDVNQGEERKVRDEICRAGAGPTAQIRFPPAKSPSFASL